MNGKFSSAVIVLSALTLAGCVTTKDGGEYAIVGAGFSTVSEKTGAATGNLLEDAR